MKISKNISLILGILILMGIVYFSINGFFIKTDTTTTGLNKYDNFAKCLTDKGATMYGAEWCGHCKDQKEMFGESFNYVNYVECPDNPDVCLNVGVSGYPTWIINGVSYPGAKSFETLSSLTGCSLS